MLEDEKKICVILGPTATNKSNLAVWLAKKINGEIISCDSMQIYKGMEIATNQITKKERENIPHHLIGFLNLKENFSVAQYVELAKKTIDLTLKKNKKPILVGGTGLYIKALLNGLEFDKNAMDFDLRKELEKEYLKKGKEHIYKKLKELDPEYAEKIHINNHKKILRGLEILILTKKNIKNYFKLNNKKNSNFKALKIGLNFKNRENLYERINKRVDLMLLEGLLDEVKNNFLKEPLKTASQAIGYKELKEYLLKKTSFKEAVLKLKQNTRKYAKRQITWFKREENVNWFFLDEDLEYRYKILNLAENFFKDK